MVDFNALLDRKYANLESATQGENALRAAQAQGILGALPSENALRGAQAFSTSEQGKTLGPLSQASIAATQAGLGLTQAQTGLVGAQTNEVGFNTFAPSSRAERGDYYDQSQYPDQNGLGGALAGQSGGFSYSTGKSITGAYPAAGSSGVTMTPLDPNDPRNKIRPIGSAGGATDVKAPAKGQKAAAPAQPPIAQAMGAPLNLHSVMAHAVNSLHAAGGMTNVPAPGQTITSGSWAGPTGPAMPMPAPLPPTPMTGGDLRAKLGMGKVRAAGGAVNIKGGTARVPGKGAPNVDSVPATLAPHEAVLNAGAAHHLGRGTIAALNALGAHTMAQAGMPPETPPTAHGVPAPARGMPKAAPKAPARGMPPAKVAAKGGRK